MSPEQLESLRATAPLRPGVSAPAASAMGGSAAGPSAAGPAPSGIERRAEPRTATNIPARLFHGRGYAGWIDCVIKDRSSKGAKIQAPAVFPMPRRLVLLDYRAGEAFVAELRWRKNDLAGLWLEAAHDLRSPLADESLEPVRQAWLALAPGLGLDTGPRAAAGEG